MSMDEYRGPIGKLIDEITMRHRDRVDQWMMTVLVANGISGTMGYHEMAEEATQKRGMVFTEDDDLYTIIDRNGKQLGVLHKLH